MDSFWILLSKFHLAINTSQRKLYKGWKISNLLNLNVNLPKRKQSKTNWWKDKIKKLKLKCYCTQIWIASTMAGIAQNGQKSLIFIVVPQSLKSERKWEKRVNEKKTWDINIYININIYTHPRAYKHI